MLLLLMLLLLMLMMKMVEILFRWGSGSPPLPSLFSSQAASSQVSPLLFANKTVRLFVCVKKYIVIFFFSSSAFNVDWSEFSPSQAWGQPDLTLRPLLKLYSDLYMKMMPPLRFSMGICDDDVNGQEWGWE